MKTTGTEGLAGQKSRLAVAAIVYAKHGSANNLLADFARDLRRRGWRVRGVIQDQLPPETGVKWRKVLVDLDDDQRFPISQRLGPGSVSCSIDPGGVAAASVALRRCLTEDTDLVVANRFGELEAGGGGLSSEMLAVMEQRIPLLTVVSEKYLEQWRRFTGGTATELPGQLEALEAWFTSLNLSAPVAD